MPRSVAKEMESARVLSQGTMSVWVIFDTDVEVEEAVSWMKGKQKVKTLIPMTPATADKLQDKKKKEIAKHYGIKLG